MKPRYDVYEKLRDMSKLNDSQVANETGIIKSTFSDWKSGRSNPGGDKVHKLCRYFGVQFSDFYDDGDVDDIFDIERIITKSEYDVILALRDKPEMYKAVRTLLNIGDEEDETDKKG